MRVAEMPTAHGPPCSGAFLVASSRWNLWGNADECLARVSEIVDWEGSGRTEPAQVERIFAKEKPDGPRKVMVVMRRVRHVTTHGP
jgi:cancer susceptibility candidate protein 1